VWVVSAGDRLLLGAPHDRIAALRDHFEKYLVMEDASHVDVSHEFSWAFAHGPRAAAIVAEVPPHHGAYGGAFDVTGLGGGALVAPKEKLEDVLAEMTREPDVVIGSDEDWETLRVQRFLPRFAVDFGDKNYPQEAALEKIAVSFSKGCYLGQEVVCRLEMRGHVVKKVVPLRLTGGDPPAAGAEVRSNEGKVVGSISSAASDDGASAGGPQAAPSTTSLALAMVRVDFTQPGTKLDVAGREATVIGQPKGPC
jgi:folate-binding protein YgfZ